MVLNSPISICVHLDLQLTYHICSNCTVATCTDVYACKSLSGIHVIDVQRRGISRSCCNSCSDNGYCLKFHSVAFKIEFCKFMYLIIVRKFERYQFIVNDVF